jgi:uracil-DNA glycosylase family 4
MADHARRAAYLGALGIDQWVPRHPPAAAVPAADAAADAASMPVTEDPWTSLQACVRDCRRCALHEGRTQTVFGTGAHPAEWMVVGEAPGAEEDRQGEPFVGPAGQLLTAMLAAIGLARESVFIANVLKCRPPGNRDPKPEEVAECLPYLEQQVALVGPRIILAFGRIAAQNLLGTEATLGSLRGVVHRFGPLNTPVVVTYHPAYLLRSPGEKRKAWEDLKFARQVFAGLPAQG